MALEYITRVDSSRNGGGVFGTGFINVVDFSASGDPATTTTVGTTAVGTSVVVTSATGYATGQGIFIAGAGAAGADYIGSITNIVSTTFTISPATSTSVAAGALVQHDDTVAIQAAIDSLADGGTVFFPDGTYKIGGALQDTGNSNAQILLPRRSGSSTSMISLMLTGFTPAPTYAVKRAKGAILKSTLTSGTGSIIGGKVSSGGWPVAGNSWCSVHLRNLTVRAPANPTNSAVNLTYYPNSSVIDCQISTDEDVIATTAPTFGITAPTTTTSYGLKLAPNNIPDQAIVENVEIYGFYTGMLGGELCNVNNTLIIFCKVGLEVPTALHMQTYKRLYVSDCETRVKFTGGDSYVDMELDLEVSSATPAWAARVYDIDDANNYGHGICRWHISDNGAVGFTLLQNGAFFLWTESLGNVNATHASSPMVQCHNSANISIAHNTLPSAGVGNVTFDTELSADPLSLHSTSSNTDRFTATKEGIVTFEVGVTFAANATGFRQLRIYKHAAAGAEILLKIINGTGNILDASSTVLPVQLQTICHSVATSPGDYFYAVVYQDSGAALNLSTANYYSPLAFFSIQR